MQPLKSRYMIAIFILVLSISTGYGEQTPTSSLQNQQTNASPKGDMPMTTATKINLSSSAFEQNGKIPAKYSGEGQDVSPALSWSSLPEETKEIALIVDDPDAPTQEPFVHWVIYKIPATVNALPEGLPKQPILDNPKGAMQGKNSFGNTGYGGPMPPKGHGLHHYHFKLYALDAPLSLKAGISKKELLDAMKNHVLAQGELVGTYER